MRRSVTRVVVSVISAAGLWIAATPVAAQTCGVLEFTGGGSKITKNVVVNITSLVVSEIDIQGDFEFTMQHGAGEFDNGCPGNSSCLAKFATDNGYENLIVGSVTDGDASDTFKLKMRLFDPGTGSFDRTVNETVHSTPETMLIDIPPLVSELLTGERPKTAAEVMAEKEDEDTGLEMDVDLFAEEDEEDLMVFGLGDEDLGITDLEMTEEDIRAKQEEERRRREEEDRRAYEEEERRREEEDRRRYEEEDRRRRQREEEDRRARDEERRRERAEKERRAREDEDRRQREREEEDRRREEEDRRRYDDEDDDDADILIFDSDASEIVIGEDDEDSDSYGYDRYEDEDDYGRSEDEDDYSYDRYEDRDDDRYDRYDRYDRDDDRDRDRYDDYDAGTSDRRNRDRYDDYDAGTSDRRDRDRYDDYEDEYERYARTGSYDEDEYENRDSRDSRDSRGDDLDGGSRSGGSGRFKGEIDKAHVCIKASAGGTYYYQGFFSYGGDIGIHVHRNVLIDMQFKGWTATATVNSETKTITLIPLAIGASVKGMRGMVHPFVGGDAVFILYQVHPETGARFAPGFKVRGGIDLKLTEVFGFFAGVNIGLAYAKHIKDVDRRLPETQFLVDGAVGILIQL